MTRVLKGLDFCVALVGCGAWGFAAFVFGSRLLSTTAGGLLGLALFFSALAMLMGTYFQESRMSRLMAGVCPRCQRSVRSEHQHRRWEPGRGEWLRPLTSWECASCGYSHGEAWPCPTCPGD